MASKELIKAIDSYDKFIEQHGVTEEAIEAYVLGAQSAFAERKNTEYALGVAKKAKAYIARFVKEHTGGTLWELEKYAFAHKTYYDILNKNYEVLKLEAQNKVVESYFLYLERNREPQERFYAPKAKQFHKFGLIEAYQDMIDDKYDILCISMPPGSGKAQPLYSKVLTPDGFVRMGDIKVGDTVISGTGNRSKVLGVYPQGVRPIYEITLDDGSSCRCSDEHLWTVQTQEDREDREDKTYRTITLSEMLADYKERKYSIDYVRPIEVFSERKLDANPYVIGQIVGGATTLFNARGYIIDESELEQYPVALELYHKKLEDRSIPTDYLYASYDDRWLLLKGLVRASGMWDNESRCATFHTPSEQAAIDVVELVHSMGGYAHMTNMDGVCWVTFQFSYYGNARKLFYQARQCWHKRFITDIRYIGEEECQCIYIDDESHLYVTDDYIVTHNTTCLKFFNSGVIGWFPKDYNLFYSHSSDITRMYYDGVYQIVSGGGVSENGQFEYTWGDIFQGLRVTSTNAKMQQLNVGKYKPFPSLQTAAVGSENAGKVRASKFLLVDDMIGKLEEALNKGILEKLWGAYTVDARQRKTMDSNNKPCKEIIQATRWSTMDPIGRIIRMYEGNPRVKVLSIPAIDKETGQSNFDYEYGGFTVEFFNDQALLMDDISYKCLYEQEPIEREGLLYHEDDLRRFSSLPQREPDAVLGVCDTKSKGVDFMVLPCFLQYGDDYYMTDCVCDDTADYSMQYEKLTRLIVDNAMQQCEFESNAGGDRVAHEVNRRVEEQGGRCNITTKATETNKETRIIVNSDWVKRHCLFKEREDYAPKSDYGTFMNWLLSYTTAGKNAHDDVVDCLANFALYVTRERRVASVEAVQNPFRTGGGYGWYGY